MATILYAWELGGGLGHVLRFRPIAERLISRGHWVVVALRDLRNAEAAFRGIEVDYLAAPHMTWRPATLIEPVRCYSDLLHNVGFGTGDDLRGLVRAWQTVISAVRPDAILCDHAPTALLAASLAEIPAAMMGTGFSCPPVSERLPDLRPWMARDRREEESVEERVLENVNAIRAANGKPRWQRLAELYSSAGDTLLTTFHELDHFGESRGHTLTPALSHQGRGGRRSGGTPLPQSPDRYLGVWEPEGGQRFTWPKGTGPRVFMYSHRFPARGWLLEHLRDRGFCTVAYTYDLPRELAGKLYGSTVNLATEALCSAQAAAECDFAILNAGHNSSAQFLLAGKPLFLLPISLEQGLLMRRLTAQGLAMSADIGQPDEIRTALNSLFSDTRYREAAEAFSTKYAHYNSEVSLDEIAERFEALATPSIA